MKRHLVLCFCSLLSLTAFAHEEGGEHKRFGGHGHEFILPGVLDSHFKPKMGPCAELNLEASQKAKLKDAYFKFKEEKIDLEGNVKKAHLNYEKVMTDLGSNLDAAKKASKEIVSAVSSRMQAQENYKNEVMFEILKPEQRSTARACLMAMSKFQHHPWDKRREHEHSKQHLDNQKSKTEGKAPSNE